MELYTAIREMRRLTKLGEKFSFTFMSYNRTRQRTDGIVTVHNARCRARNLCGKLSKSLSMSLPKQT